MEIKMFLLTTARVERSRVGRKALKHRIKARKLLIKALRHQRKPRKHRVKALNPNNHQPKPLKRLPKRLTSASPTR